MWHYSLAILLLCVALGNSLPTSIADIIKEGEQSSSQAADEVSNLPETTQPLSPNRRVITYDQRQEGKYNIRADLENFVIMVIPSSPTSASALLSLLTRSKYKKNHGKNNLKRKYAQKVEGEAKEDVKKLDYLPVRAAADHSERSNTRIIEHFIEGRTPYKVDISSTGEYLHPQVQVMQPNYARSLRSPVVRLEPEEPVASVVPVKGNSIPIQNSVTVNDRESKTLFEANQVVDSNTNSLVILTPNDNDYNSETNRGFVDLTDSSNSFDSLNVGNIDQFTIGTKEADKDDGSNSSNDEDRGWELTLLGSPQEQCGPDRKRDSYGVCQFVPQYY